MKFKKLLALGAVASSSIPVLAEGTVEIPQDATDMFVACTSFITEIQQPLSAMLIAAFGVVIVFVAYKLAKRAINKV